MKPVAKPLHALTAGEPGYGSHMGSARGPRGRFLALEQAQAGFKLLEVAVTLAFVMMFSGWLLASPNVRMNCFMGLARASSRANRRKPPRIVTGDKVRCYSALCARLLRCVR